MTEILGNVHLLVVLKKNFGGIKFYLTHILNELSNIF